ncbi:hypothetical protein CLOM_g6914 [Closterium sp. NIES-68]|nr:hypothetical protein CLOM_g6914 [Closterium sp. NIES-68]GJP69952.1 hypothetical protein CLOP_g946 [Closterium sp. NIES-67]
MPQPRTVQHLWLTYECMSRTSPRERNRLRRAWSTHFEWCALWAWGFVETEWGNLYEAIGICLMHVVDEGLWLHIMRYIAGLLMPDEQRTLLRYCRVVLMHTLPSALRTPDPSAYFKTVAAWEHRAMMQILSLFCHLPGHEDVGRVVVMFADWVAAFSEWRTTPMHH